MTLFNKINIINEYLQIKENDPIGSSIYTPLIIMVNNEYKLVSDLLDHNNTYYKNMLSFFDNALWEILKNDRYPDKINFESEYLINSICYVLGAFKSIKEIQGDQVYKLKYETFIKYLNDGKGFKKEVLTNEKNS